MSNHLKKNGFLLTIPRLFTRGRDAADLIHFRETEQAGEETSPAIEAPDNWGQIATEILATQAAAKSIPAEIRAIEENTVPSWLWQRTAGGEGTTEENSAQQIFDRVVGSAIYNGWKQNLFANETEARNFYSEARYALFQRYIAMEPATLATTGLEWAYGLKPETKAKSAKTTAAFEISNAMVDAAVGGSLDKMSQGKWQKLLDTKPARPVALQFSDITADWGITATQAPAVLLDLLAFRHNDGFVNIEALCHATRLSVLLLDLQDAPALSIGFANLAPLLVALAIPYDSDAGRTMAASIAAIITAEAYAASAELACLRGASKEYTTQREVISRALRNHRRAAYGDHSDYEKISVLPAPLDLRKSPDLALTAEAQHRWDDVLELVHKHGLRQIQVTGIQASQTLAMFMESTTQGIEPLNSLTVLQHTENETFERNAAPFVTEALSRLNYDRTTGRSVINHIAGHQTLEKAPAINHAALRAKGFDRDTLQRIEDYLPQGSDIRLAITPWVVGQNFCRKALKISPTKLADIGFSLLHHLGFSDDDIGAANTYCYGHNSVKSAKDLKPKHAALFASGYEVSAEARIRMAAAVQSFVSGETGLQITLPAAMPAEKSEKILLGAWRQGVKSLSFHFDARLDAPVAEEKKGKTRVAAFLHTKKPSLPARKVKMKASRSLVSKPSSSAKPAAKGRSK